MLQQVPGALARLGVRTPGEPCPDIHQPTFVVDEACIRVGLRVTGRGSDDRRPHCDLSTADRNKTGTESLSATAHRLIRRSESRSRPDHMRCNP